MEYTGPEVGWLHSLRLVFTRSSTLLCPGLWRQTAHNPDGVRERQTNKHQNNVTGTVTGPNGELRGKEGRSMQHKIYPSGREGQ